MMDLADYVGALVLLNGGKIVGKTRLQKTAYLLEASSIGFGIDFDYHDYGPFSAELAFAADDAESLEYIETNLHPGFHSVPYTIFESTDEAPKFEKGKLTDARRKALEAMKGCSALILELAATAVFLKENGYRTNSWDEVRKRKPSKATPDLLKQAKKLISDLRL